MELLLNNVQKDYSLSFIYRNVAFLVTFNSHTLVHMHSLRLFSSVCEY